MPCEKASGLWRSEDMIRLDIITQREVLHDTIIRIGLLGKAQFIDMNNEMTPFLRPYTAEVRRCDDLLRNLNFITSELEKGNYLKYDSIPLLPTQDSIYTLMRTISLDDAEEIIHTFVSELRTTEVALQGLRREINYHEELSLLHQRLKELIPIHSLSQSSTLSVGVQTPYVLGLVDAQRVELLYSMTYRATRGNALIEIENKPAILLDPKTGERCIAKTPFVVFAPSLNILKRVERLLASIGATVHTVEDVSKRVSEEEKETENELYIMYKKMQERKEEILQRSSLSYYNIFRIVKMEKRVFWIMNLCSVSGTTCTASVWIPKKYEESLRKCLSEAFNSSSGDVLSVISTHISQKNPPTYFETNNFIKCFQGIVDSYGMARYKEVNPGVFTIITFPYLFGIMYGDIGHGILLLLLAIYFTIMETHWRGHRLNEMIAMLINGRYLLLLMGFFSIYMGILYNDFFGFSVGFFSSSYIWSPINDQNGTVYPLNSFNRTFVYPVGLDVAWTETENKLEFYNSVKMKCAVIVGVIQMLTGNILSLLNHIYNGEYIKIFFLFIPEVIFLLCTFGYMSIIIIIKWCIYWENTNEAPSILETMTNFFLQPGTVTQPIFKGQSILQVILLLLAFLMIPVMLIMMPLIEARKYKRNIKLLSSIPNTSSMILVHSNSIPRNRSRSRSVFIESHNNNNNNNNNNTSHTRLHNPSWTLTDVTEIEETRTDNVYSDHGSTVPIIINSLNNEIEELPHFDLSEIIIHYMIHTIEYVLGCVSNTASYLRLWALSLAHAQLSEVFFTFAIVKVLSFDNIGIFITLGIAIWLLVTLAVLVGMEALSAFLHALRLHWVEFNNKFYAADGVAFDNFDLLNSDE